MKTTELQIWANEVAALIAEGWLPEKVRTEKDLTHQRLEEIFDSEEFRTALASHGDLAVAAFSKYREDTDAQTARNFLAGRITRYIKELDGLVTSSALKPEKRADILLALVRFGAPEDESLQRREVQLSPALLNNIAVRHRAFDRIREGFLPHETSDKGGEE